MTSTQQVPSIGITGQAVSPRVASIDIFRGLTMIVMIFVNEVSEIKGLPWWTHHAHAQENLMTYVDMVFPFFLFIVGMSLPLAVKQRLKRNESIASLWLHILLRAGGLVTIGLVLANAEQANASLMHINANVWALLALLGAGLYLNVYGSNKLETGKTKPSYAVLRYTGLALVIAMYAIFRRTTHSGEVAWINGAYPEILGLIGFTYFAVCILYIPTRRWLGAPIVWFLLLLAFNALTTAKIIPLHDGTRMYVNPFDNGAMACITMAGIIVSSIFLGNHRWNTPRQKMLIASAFGIVTLVAGYFFTPLGISKIRATPTWSLYSIGAATLIFTGLYWICDVKKQTGWAFFTRSAGSNTLLTYLLPDLWYYIFGALGITYLDTHFHAGWVGVVRTVVFTVVILAISAVLTRAKVRLQL